MKDIPATSTALEDQMAWPLRPIITSLNGDQSWLFSFPRPKSDDDPKFYYHVVFEPWLSGATSVFSPWIVYIELPHLALVSSIEALDKIILQIETTARTAAEKHGMERPELDSGASSGEDNNLNDPLVDAILLIFHYSDHVHEATLRLFDKRIPVVASIEAKAIVEKMKHFEIISLTSDLNSSASTWRTAEIHPTAFPTWLTAFKCPVHHELNFVGVIVWTHDDEDGNEIHEAILESPHGVSPERVGEGSFETFLKTEPQTVKLALMHGLKESHAVGMINTYGARGGLSLYRKIGGARYWTPTHHSELKYSGIMMRTLWVHDTPRTLEWALEREGLGGDGDKPNMIHIENGGSLVLA